VVDLLGKRERERERERESSVAPVVNDQQTAKMNKTEEEPCRIYIPIPGDDTIRSSDRSRECSTKIQTVFFSVL